GARGRGDRDGPHSPGSKSDLEVRYESLVGLRNPSSLVTSEQRRGSGRELSERRYLSEYLQAQALVDLFGRAKSAIERITDQSCSEARMATPWSEWPDGRLARTRSRNVTVETSLTTVGRRNWTAETEWKSVWPLAGTPTIVALAS